MQVMRIGRAWQVAYTKRSEKYSALVINPGRRNVSEDLLPVWEVGVKIDLNETGLEVVDCTGLDSFSPAWISWRKAVTKLPRSE